MRITSAPLWLLASLVALCLMGCPSSPSGGAPCDTDGDCPMGEYCEGGGVGCTFECRLDVDCTGGRRCSTRGRCEVPGLDGGVPGDAAPDAPTACRNDGDCDDGVFCNGIERCTPGGAGAGADGCVAGPAACPSGATCDEATDACRTTCDEDTDGNGRLDADNDGDGHRSIACGPAGTVPGDDCDDEDAERYPSVLREVCDITRPNHDEDCNPCTVAAYGTDGDLDHDGYVSSACSNPLPPEADPATFMCPVTVAGLVSIDRVNRLVNGLDCLDTMGGGADVHPTGTEVCNDIDDNCDGTIDEGVIPTWYADLDGDGYGDAAGGTSMQCMMPMGFSATTDDCDDDRATGASVHPGAVEACGAALVDDDCDGSVNEGCMCVAGTEMSCTAPYPGCPAATQLCVMDPPPGGGSHWGACSSTPALVTCWTDGDRDGFAPAGAASSMACACPPGTTAIPPSGANIDCNDSAIAEHPGATETCNGRDDDCAGGADDIASIPASYRCVAGSARRSCGDPSCAGVTGYQDCVNCQWTSIRTGVPNDCRREGWECVAGSSRPCSVTAGADGRYGINTCSGANACASSCTYAAACTISTPESCDFVDNNCNGSLDEGIGGCCGWQWTWTTCGAGGLGDDTHNCDGTCRFPDCYPVLTQAGSGNGYYTLEAPIQVAGLMNYDIGAFTDAATGGWGATITAGNRVGPAPYGVPPGPGLAVIWDQAAGRLRVYNAGSLVADRACSRRSGTNFMNVFILGDNIVAGVGPAFRDRSWCEISTVVPNFMRDNLGEPRYFGSVAWGGGYVDMSNIWLTRSGFLGSAGTCDTGTYCGACF